MFQRQVCVPLVLFTLLLVPAVFFINNYTTTNQIFLEKIEKQVIHMEKSIQDKLGVVEDVKSSLQEVQIQNEHQEKKLSSKMNELKTQIERVGKLQSGGHHQSHQSLNMPNEGPCPLCDYHKNRKPNNLAYETSYVLSALLETNYHCNDLRGFGGLPNGDGVWHFCLDKPVTKDDCLVYSFGINFDFSFDNETANTLGCDVYCFDPSMGWTDREVSDKLHFYNLGLDGKSHVNSKGWKLETFKEIREKLGHKDRVIDFLKIDVEYSEWDAFETFLRDGSLNKVNQIAFEVHFWFQHTPEGHKRWGDILNELRQKGFYLYHWHENPMSSAEHMGYLKQQSCCFEVSFIRLD